MVGMNAYVGSDSIHVLLVDDDSSLLESVRQILLTMGNFEIDCSTSVEEAYRKMLTNNYDVIVSDYEMPQKDGKILSIQSIWGKNYGEV